MNEADKLIDASSESSEHEVTTDNQVSKRTPLWRIVLLCAVGGAVDLGYAVEGAYGAPLIVAAGLDIQYASLMLGLSPILGILFQAYLGTLSDQCQCKWGRRRPFILILSLTLCLGFSIAPFAPYLSTLSISGAKHLGILMTVVGILLLDFSLGQLQLPSRAYLLDSVPTSQSQMGNFIYAVLIGSGACLGFILSAIDWVKFLNRDINIINEIQVVFGITIVFVLMSLLCTLVSVKETLYQVTEGENDAGTCLKCCPCAKSPQNCCLDFFSTILDPIKFICHMSKQMWILWFAVLSFFVSNFALLLFFTTFTGETVYGGISNAPEDTKAYQLYVEGVRMGSWVLAGGAGLAAILSLVMDRIANWIGLRTLFLVIQYLFVVSSFALTVFNNHPATMILSIFGILNQTIYLSIPFTLISKYKVRKRDCKTLVIIVCGLNLNLILFVGCRYYVPETITW